MEAIVNKLGDNGIYTLVDLHQDLFSRYFCGEGVPDYLAEELIEHQSPYEFPFPLKGNLPRENGTNYPDVNACLKAPHFGLYYFTISVNDAFTQLYNTSSRINNDLRVFWAIVSKRFAANPNVIGYDLLNEPIAGNLYKTPWTFIDPSGSAGRKYLMPLYEQLAEVIRKYDNDHILFFESAVNNAAFSNGFTFGPGGPAFRDRQVYSYHIYCLFVDSSGCPVNLALCQTLDEAAIKTKVKEVKKMGCGGMMTEFGALAEYPDCVQEINTVVELSHKYFQGWVYWEYKHYNDLTTANRDQSAGLFYTNKSTQEMKLKALLITHAKQIAGTPLETYFDLNAKSFYLKYSVDPSIARLGATTQIMIYAHHYPIKANPYPFEYAITPKEVIEQVNIALADGGKYYLLTLAHKESAIKSDTVIEVRITRKNE